MSRQFRSDDTDPWVLGFGDGSDGDLTISSNTTEAPIDASCSGTSGTTSLSATNASFATGQLILIHQTRGTGAGNWELNKIAGYTAGTITTSYALQNTYTDSGASQAQVRVMRQYNNVTINSGQTWTAKAWNGDVGGILAFFAKGIVTVTGNINVAGNNPTTNNAIAGIGFTGGNALTTYTQSNQGEGINGTGSASVNANGNAGGGGYGQGGSGAGGGGGSHATAGTNGEGGASYYGRGATTTYGTSGLTTMLFGGGGGGTSFQDANSPKAGGSGGGIALIITNSISITGGISSNGGAFLSAGATQSGGGGAGGSVLIKAKTATLGTNLITALGGDANAGYEEGGTGGVGRIHLDYKTSYTGTTNPTLDYTQDATLDYVSSFIPKIMFIN